jgi:anti-sigma regulatory factor (Ser/Thr protein kinase)
MIPVALGKSRHPMQPTTLLPIRLRPELSELEQLVGYVESFANRQDLSPADANVLALAAEELFVNTATHSNPPANWVEYSLARCGDSVVATYSDDAQPYDPTQQEEPDTTLPVEARPIGGLGIHFIRKTMQSFHYARIDGRNVVTLTRRLVR